jgi:hypothetical protein
MEGNQQIQGDPKRFVPIFYLIKKINFFKNLFSVVGREGEPMDDRLQL